MNVQGVASDRCDTGLVSSSLRREGPVPVVVEVGPVDVQEDRGSTGRRWARGMS